MGRLIVIDGLDGSGKSTQLSLLERKLNDAVFISFPNYETNTGRVITDYLNDGFRETDPEISAYSASIIYASDRYVSFKRSWENAYNSGKTVISARYVSSNAIYQMTKLDKDKWDSYLDWLNDLEYIKLRLPRPDITVFLDMPTHISQELLSKRYDGDESKKDIHERNKEFLADCREAALYASKKFGWKIFECARDNAPRSAEDINEELVRYINTTKGS